MNYDYDEKINNFKNEFIFVICFENLSPQPPPSPSPSLSNDNSVVDHIRVDIYLESYLIIIQCGDNESIE
ncbi:hypothetical protein DERP_012869 [Dermatophagoides pteronyssinus]|uniref:Uncharacterized protein n=1 Tax=Dermatophagoides pteronyssinus TaxID=6956 RepID=A0ABQ8J1V9_DERPT|nr:hypothetical protein DERP_012869 [Dermatophagoides pteronyssinus]